MVPTSLLEDGRQFGQDPSNIVLACHGEARAQFADRLGR